MRRGDSDGDGDDDKTEDGRVRLRLGGTGLPLSTNTSAYDPRKGTVNLRRRMTAGTPDKSWVGVTLQRGPRA
jgi:hypothetical protein